MTPRGVPRSLVGLGVVLIADCELELVSALLNIGHCTRLVMSFLLRRVDNYRVFSIDTCVVKRFNVDPLGVCEWKLFLESVMRLLGDRATADVGLSRWECSMLSVINRFRLAVSGLSLMVGSGHNTESFLVEACLDGWKSILFGSADVPLTLDLECGPLDGSIKASEGAADCLGSNPLTAVNPWAGIALSIEYRRPEWRS